MVKLEMDQKISIKINFIMRHASKEPFPTIYLDLKSERSESSYGVENRGIRIKVFNWARKPN